MDANGSPRTIDRRDFLKTTAAAGLALGSRSLGASAAGTNDLRVALVGAGNQGMVLLESCQKSGVAIIAASSRPFSLSSISRRSTYAVCSWP